MTPPAPRAPRALRIATIGTSMITGRFIDAARLAGPDAAEVTVATSRSLERARTYADEHGIAGAASDLRALWASGSIDAVYIGSPNGAHFAQALEAIADGIHVFLEKPATTTVAEFEQLVEAAAARGVTVFEGMRTAYDPGLAAIAALLPELGVLRRASFAYCQRSARYDLVLQGQTPNIFDPALAGGALRDLGVYPLSAAVALFGAPRGIRSLSVAIATGADGTGTALLDYDGFIADIQYSKITVSSRPSEIQGEKGTLAIDHITQPRLLTLTRLDGSVQEYPITAEANNMVYEVERFVALARGQADATSDHERTLATLQIVEHIAAEM